MFTVVIGRIGDSDLIYTEHVTASLGMAVQAALTQIYNDYNMSEYYSTLDEFLVEPYDIYAIFPGHLENLAE